MDKKISLKSLKTPLLIVGLCVLAIGGVIALNTYDNNQQMQAEITELYDQCMDDDYLPQTVEGTSNRKKFCQCRAKMMHSADMGMMTTREVARDMGLISTSVVLNDVTGNETSTEGIANIGSYLYCGMTIWEEE